MAIRDWLQRMSERLSGGSERSSRRPDGGTSYYRPLRKKQQGEPMGAEVPVSPGDGASIPYVHTGFTGMNPPVEPSYTPQPAFEPVERPGNIAYMPGVVPGSYAPDAGNSYTHVEHLMTMTSLRSCYEAIACMKDGETLIISLDAIANENEIMRCQDMLAGAAFTLGCTVRTIPSARMVIIAPEGVKILPEEAPRYQRPAAPAPEPVPQEAGYTPRRERRVSQNSAEWEAARNGQRPNYNPYTGSMPAAVGDYSSFGGYGYY